MKIFSIYGGRTSFWQWDLGQRLIVSDDTCNEVHFDNGTTEKALINKVYEVDGMRLVDVPNILLQSDRLLKVFTFVKDETGQHTEYADIFSVIQRAKPEDYTYPEAGGYYIPVISQTSNDAMQIDFEASRLGMEDVAPVIVTLPVGPQGPQGEKGEAPDAVLYTEQTLTDEQKSQARENIGAMGDLGVTVADAGKFLRVSADGVWEAQTVINGEEVAW